MNSANIITDIANWKQGWKTSEFWVVLVPAFVAILNVLGVHVSNSDTTHILLIVWGAVSAVYVAARTYIKKIRISHIASLASILHTIEEDILNQAKQVQAEAPKQAVPLSQASA